MTLPIPGEAAFDAETLRRAAAAAELAALRARDRGEEARRLIYASARTSARGVADAFADLASRLYAAAACAADQARDERRLTAETLVDRCSGCTFTDETLEPKEGNT